MRTRRVIIAAVAAVVMGLALYVIWPVLCYRLGKEGCCARCDMRLYKLGPFVIEGSLCVSRISGLEPNYEGDPFTFCQTRGHVWTADKSQRGTINDWQHQRDAYNSDAEYNANNPSKVK
jgi:hypothetical protein